MVICEAEEWRAAPGWENCYEVSNLGRVRSLHFAGLIRKPVPDHDGYPRVLLFDKGKRKRVKVHRLVALAFHGDKRSILHKEVAHLDGDRANPRADNLKWVSHVENHSHRRAHGTHPAGSSHPRAKLTDEAVRDIRLSEQSLAILAERYGVSPHTISDARRGKRWRHVPIGNRG